MRRLERRERERDGVGWGWVGLGRRKKGGKRERGIFVFSHLNFIVLKCQLNTYSPNGNLIIDPSLIVQSHC